MLPSRSSHAVLAMVGTFFTMNCVTAAVSTPHQRKIFAWASPNNATIAQLTNASWAGIFDGVHAGCGVAFSSASDSNHTRNGKGIRMVVNETTFAKCAPLKAAVESTGGEFQVWTNGVPQALVDTPTLRPAFIASAIAAAHSHGIRGFSIDDESDCAPRSTLKNFTACQSIATERAPLSHFLKIVCFESWSSLLANTPTEDTHGMYVLAFIHSKSRGRVHQRVCRRSPPSPTPHPAVCRRPGHVRNRGRTVQAIVPAPGICKLLTGLQQSTLGVRFVLVVVVCCWCGGCVIGLVCWSVGCVWVCARVQWLWWRLAIGDLCHNTPT